MALGSNEDKRLQKSNEVTTYNDMSWKKKQKTEFNEYFLQALNCHIKSND